MSSLSELSVQKSSYSHKHAVILFNTRTLAQLVVILLIATLSRGLYYSGYIYTHSTAFQSINISTHSCTESPVHLPTVMQGPIISVLMTLVIQTAQRLLEIYKNTSIQGINLSQYKLYDVGMCWYYCTEDISYQSVWAIILQIYKCIAQYLWTLLCTGPFCPIWFNIFDSICNFSQ